MIPPGMEAIENNGGLFAVLAVWTTFWEGLALWKAAGRREKGWFVALLIFNIGGVIPIMYLFLFNDKKHASADDEQTPAETKE